MSKRYYTVAEANSLVPHLESVFGTVLRLRLALRSATQELESLGAPLTDETLRSERGSPSVVRLRARARGLLEALTEELRGLHLLGISVKDLETGLCDFTALRNGREVYLCWRLGEKRIDFWHELHTGFAGRQPIDAQPERLLH